MTTAQLAAIVEAKKAALDVLIHNARGPFEGLPRTAGWGYPEPYTRDLMIAALGILASGNRELIDALRRTLEMLAVNQTDLGHIPSLAHDANDVGASDTTPLFLLALGIYRRVTGEPDFLDKAGKLALSWMEYQSPSDGVIVAQQPTSDWRDEQWVLGFGLFVNAVTYAYLRMFGFHERARTLRTHLEDHLRVHGKPYYALWGYKSYRSERFDLLGNSLAVIAEIMPHQQARALIRWVEDECEILRRHGDLTGELPPNLFPYILPDDEDWLPRYEHFNQPGEYHNGGIWPFISAFYVVATLAAGFPKLAEEKLVALTQLVHPARDASLDFGFNEWIRAQDGTPQGQDWQTWSAAMYLYAAACVEQRRVLFFEEIRSHDVSRS